MCTCAALARVVGRDDGSGEQSNQRCSSSEAAAAAINQAGWPPATENSVRTMSVVRQQVAGRAPEPIRLGRRNLAQPNRDETARDTRASTVHRHAAAVPGWWPADGSRRRRHNPVTELSGRTGKTDRHMRTRHETKPFWNRAVQLLPPWHMYTSQARLGPSLLELHSPSSELRSSSTGRQPASQPFRVRPS